MQIFKITSGLLMEWMFQEKFAPHQNDRYHPGNWENDKKNFQRRCPGKYSKDPCNPKLFDG